MSKLPVNKRTNHLTHNTVLSLSESINKLRPDLDKLRSHFDHHLAADKTATCNVYVHPKPTCDIPKNTILDVSAMESYLGGSVLSILCIRTFPPYAYKVKIPRSALFLALSNSKTNGLYCRLWFSASPSETVKSHKSNHPSNSPQSLSCTTKNIRISSWNCRGLPTAVPFINQLAKRTDVILLQEHWLWPYDLHQLDSLLQGFSSYGIADSRLSPLSQLTRGCGGVAILWRNLLQISPIKDVH